MLFRVLQAHFALLVKFGSVNWGQVNWGQITLN
jgi:hypothetical protein